MMSRNFTKREKILLLVLCVLLLGILYYQFVYKTTEETIKEYDTIDLETDLQIEQSKALSIQNMKDEIEANTSSETGVVASYNNIKNELAALNDIFASATSYNLDFGQAVQDGDAVRRQVSINFTAGSYSSAKAIIDDLHNCQYRCLIRTVSVSTTGTGLKSGEVSVTMDVTFFETMYNANSSSGLEAATNEGDKKTATE